MTIILHSKKYQRTKTALKISERIDSTNLIIPKIKENIRRRKNYMPTTWRKHMAKYGINTPVNL